jgi:hypothetical protein
MASNPNNTAMVPDQVQVIASTWARDSHDLFDFEAHQLHTKTFNITSSSKCLRNGTDVQVVADNADAPEGADPLLRIVRREGNFWVDKASSASNSKKLWLVVRDLATNGHKLSEGDVIKLGRFKFRVRQLVGSGNGAQPELKLDDNGTVCQVDASRNKEDDTRCCRICLLEGPGDDDDPLIAPCDCKGSIEYVHLGCLRHWIRGRLNLPDTPMGSYFYRPLPCELCKSVYPTQIMQDSDRVPLVEVPQTQPPFVVLENMVRDSQQHSSRGLHVISLAEKQLKLGRGHESDVRIADVSISRCHATISFVRGSFVLEDNNSKFGTLVAMKKPRQLDASSPLSIQMGRTVLSLSLQSASSNSENSISPYVHQLPGSNAQDERNLRLSLLSRGSNANQGRTGPPEMEVDAAGDMEDATL